MHQPVTTNPFIIMLINMTVVFIVLVALMYLIKLIHIIDPTKPKEVKTEVPKAAPVQVEPTAETTPAQDTLQEEVVVAISAALYNMGETGTVKAIRPINRDGWKQSGRVQNMNM